MESAGNLALLKWLQFFSCHSFSDEPGKPGTPKIEDWGPNHCDLSWKAPETDGGAPITHYEIEYMVNEHL